MRVVTRTKLAMASHWPSVVANLTAAFGFLPRGQRIYLVDPQDTAAPDCRILGRTNLGKMLDIHVPWSIVENVRVENVPSVIASVLSQFRIDELPDIVKRINDEKIGPRDDWSVRLD